MTPGSVLLYGCALTLGALLILGALVLLGPSLLALAQALRATSTRLFTMWLEGLRTMGTWLGGAQVRAVASLEPMTDAGPAWVGRTAIVALWITAAWALSVYIEFEVMRARMLALVGSDADPFAGDNLGLLIGLWHAAALAIMTTIFCEACSIGGPSSLFLTEGSRRTAKRCALVGAGLVAATGLGAVIVSVEAVAGLDDPSSQAIFWSLYIVTAMLTLFLGGFALVHALSLVWCLALVVVRLACALCYAILATVHLLVDCLLALATPLLAIPAAIGGWIGQHRPGAVQKPSVALVPLPASTGPGGQVYRVPVGNGHKRA